MNHPPQRMRSSLLLLLLVALVICIPAFSQKLFASDEGSIELTMKSAAPSLSDSNDLYSLSDARFGVYDDIQCTQKVGELVTDETGTASLGGLSARRYYVRQELASPGFSMTERLLQIDVPLAKTVSENIACMPSHAKPELLVQELNGETSSPCGVAGAKLGDAIYTISYYNSFDSDSILNGATRTWQFRSDANGKVALSPDYLVKGSPLFVDSQGELLLPIGKYTLKMDEAPQGFLLAQSTLTTEVTASNRDSVDARCEFCTFDQPLSPIRGDVMFRKTDANGNPLSGIPFLLISEDTGAGENGESHVIVTNEYGDYCSHSEYAAHDLKTNASDEAIRASVDATYELDESLLDAAAGIWFSKDAAGAITIPNNGIGALPYGSYRLQELPCSRNEGMNLSSVRFSVHRNAYTVTLDNIVNTAPSIIGFACESKSSNKLIRPQCDIVACNQVSYSNLVVGKSYTLSTTAHVNSTGSTVPGADESPAAAIMDFVAAAPSGVINIEIPLDASSLAGEKITLLSELKSEDGMLVKQKNANISDQELTVEPIVDLCACDNLDSDKYCMGSDAVIHERMNYEGLRTDVAYTLICTLNDKATGNAVRDAQGNAVTASIEFIPEARSGYLDLTIPFDADKVAGHDVVIFDKLVDDNGVTIADHQDIDDEQQAVKTVKLTSSATDKADGDKIFDASSSEVVVLDTVNYANLVPGEQYVFHGTLMDKETGTALMQDEAPITATVPFVPSEVSGSTDVEYPFDASAQSSQVIVAFETLEHDGLVIAQHADLEDVAQTVTSEEYEGGDAASGTQPKYGKGTNVSTGDFWVRVFLAVVACIGGIALCAAFALRHRRRCFEAIARLGDTDR